MKLSFLHYALPMAFVAALPLLDVADNMAPRHTPPPALAPWESVRLDGLREEKMDNKTVHFSHFNAARAELKLTTMHMAKEAVANAGANDADMDLAFNLEYGLADLGANSEGSDTDINADFNVDNNLSDLRVDATADADINNEFSLDNELADLSANSAAADAEINALFVAGR